MERLEQRKNKVRALMTVHEQGGGSGRNLMKSRSSDGGSTMAAKQ